VFPDAAKLVNAALPPGFCAWIWAADVPEVRGITVDSVGDVLALSRGSTAVVALWDANGDGVSAADERTTVATYTGLNHGVALHGGYLYASRDRAVVRWPYTANRSDLGAGAVVVNAIPTGGHVTRSLAFDEQYLYVSVGSGSNLDATSDRARIRRFALSSFSTKAIPFGNGEVFADGLRNEVGLAFDTKGRLWGVENGVDDLDRADLGGDIHEQNPAEELNLFAEPGRFYGYPYCWSEFSLPIGVGLGAGQQWAAPTTMLDGTHSDTWCRQMGNVVPPVLAMQAHSAPLDIAFYQGGAFPREYVGDAFITFHGSWNRTLPTGYKVMRVSFGTDGMPQGAPTPFLEYAGDGDVAADWPHRPVALATLPSGVLLVTSDASSSILAIGYRP
jgi:glucose/arabinose dehydrogenase